MVQLETVVKEVKAVVNSQPLVYVGTDFSSGFTPTSGDLLSLNPKTGVPSLAEEYRLLDPDFLCKLSSSQKLFDMWCKGQKHLNMFWKLWFDQYVLSLREQTQKYLKAPRTRSSTQPSKGDIVLLKESSPRVTWKLAVVEELMSSTDGEIRAASGKLLNRTLDFLYPLECTEQRETPVQPSQSEDDQYDASHQRTGQKLPTEHPIRKAAIKARQALNKLLKIANYYLLSSNFFLRDNSISFC